MKKIQLMGLLLVAVGAFSAFAAASASALSFALAEWLENGNAITSTVLTETKGNLLFGNVLNGAEFLCGTNVVFDGWAGPNGADEVTEVLNSGVAVAELDETGATGGISCTGVKTCETGTEIWPLNLPFLTVAQLDTEDSTFWDLAQANANGLFPAYWILCLFLGGSVNELCETVTGTMGELSNAATDVETLGLVSPDATCNGNLLEGLIENNAGDVALIEVPGQTLQISN